MQNGFLGITVSSEQVGWAVTNPKYELERASRKDLWGVRLFDKAETAEETLKGFDGIDTEQIQKDIQNCRKAQEQERCPAIAYRTQNAGQIIVQQCKWYSDKNYDQIRIRISKNIIRNRKQMQDLSTG